jgi:predicted porin
MKKSLFAIAAATAFTGAAHAQSSVTVYGILDVGYIAQNYKQAGAAGQNTAANTLPTNAQANGFGSSAETTSRIGFRGTEDLGGGLAAVFTVEFGITPTNNSNISGTATGFNNRQSFVGLSKKGIGTGLIGNQYTPIHEAVAATDPGQQNNMPGNVIYPSDTVTNNQVIATQTTGQYQARPTLASGNGDGTVSYTIRAGNSIKFVSDSFAGFRGKLFYAAMNSNQTATSTVTNGVTTNAGGNINSGGWGLGLDYTWQKLLVTANIQQFKQTQFAGTITNNGSANSTPAQALGGTSWGTAVNSTDDQMYFGATYDFGILKAYAQYVSRKAAFTADTNQYAKRTAQQIGVRGYITKTVEGWANMGMGKVTNAYDVPGTGTRYAIQSGSGNISGYQLGANYWLSKRTNLYGIFGVSSMSNVAYPTTAAGSVAASNAVSSNQAAYALGVRHTF